MEYRTKPSGAWQETNHDPFGPMPNSGSSGIVRNVSGLSPGTAYQFGICVDLADQNPGDEGDLCDDSVEGQPFVKASAGDASAVYDEFTTQAAPPPPADPVVAASGDIACGSNSTGATCRQGATANVLGTISGLNAVLPLGDVQYECGELSNFNNFYNPSWGRFKSITRPAVGNHEYRVSDPTNECLPQGPGAPGYYSYFGSALASPLDPGCTSNCRGFYSYNLGTWHLVALNSNCSQRTPSGTVIGCSPGSLQYNWLKNDLANARKNCIVAYWHHPRYSSGGRQTSSVQGLWEALYDAGADVVLTGHDHVYERFNKLGRGTSAAIDPVADANGIREWVVGVGGRNFTSWSTIRQQSQIRDRSAFGVLKLTLHSNSYDWKFQPELGKTFTDSGTTTCNGAPVA